MKVLFVDVDGTLTDYSNNIPKSAVKAIRKTRELGNRVYICTGRMEAEIYPEIRNIGFDGMIGGNGAYVRDGDEIVLAKFLSKEQCRQVVDWCFKKDLGFYLEANSGLYAGNDLVHKGAAAMRRYALRNGLNDFGLEDFFPDMIPDGDLYRDDVSKISFALNSYEDHLESIKEFPDLKAGVWGGASHEALFGDLGVPGISKKTAIEALLKHLNIPKQDAIAFGDSRLDILMFEACGYGVAMGSGAQECRQAADYVTDDTDKDGLYKAFEYLKLAK